MAIVGLLVDCSCLKAIKVHVKVAGLYNKSLTFNVKCCNRKCQIGETAMQRLEFLNFC